jgi:hypothetical protein
MSVESTGVVKAGDWSPAEGVREDCAGTLDEVARSGQDVQVSVINAAADGLTWLCWSMLKHGDASVRRLKHFRDEPAQLVELGEK